MTMRDKVVVHSPLVPVPEYRTNPPLDLRRSYRDGQGRRYTFETTSTHLWEVIKKAMEILLLAILSFPFLSLALAYASNYTDEKFL